MICLFFFFNFHYFLEAHNILNTNIIIFCSLTYANSIKIVVKNIHVITQTHTHTQTHNIMACVVLCEYRIFKSRWNGEESLNVLKNIMFLIVVVCFSDALLYDASSVQDYHTRKCKSGTYALETNENANEYFILHTLLFATRFYYARELFVDNSY